MAYQPVENTASVELVFWNGATYSENVFHYKTSAPMIESKMQTLALALRTWWADEIKFMVPATIFLFKIKIKDLTTQNGLGIEYNAGMPLPGDTLHDPLPMNCTVAVKWTTGYTGRSFRGRTYHIGIGDTLATGDLLNSDTAVALQAGYEALLDVKADEADTGWVVVSRWENLLPRTAGLATPITGCSVDRAMDSQRRRLLGRGW